eukprot:gene4733-6277_t
MGATLPAIERVTARWREQGSGVGALYAGNTAGAVAGVLAAAFWLVPAYGLAATAGVCAVLNLLCAAVAWQLFRETAEPGPLWAATQPAGTAGVPGSRHTPGRLTWILGFTGLLSFGHAAFLGGAAYVAGHAIKVWGLTPEVGLLLGTAGGALLGLLFGWLAIRRQGIYFSMITLALAQMLFFACLQAKFTGGEDGLQGVPRGKLFGVIDLQSDLVMYYVALVIV